MNYLTIPEYALTYQISAVYLKRLCEMQKIEGAVRFGRIWVLPENSVPMEQLMGRIKRDF